MSLRQWKQSEGNFYIFSLLVSTVNPLINPQSSSSLLYQQHWHHQLLPSPGYYLSLTCSAPMAGFWFPSYHTGCSFTGFFLVSSSCNLLMLGAPRTQSFLLSSLSLLTPLVILPSMITASKPPLDIWLWLLNLSLAQTSLQTCISDCLFVNSPQQVQNSCFSSPKLIHTKREYPTPITS